VSYRFAAGWSSPLLPCVAASIAAVLLVATSARTEEALPVRGGTFIVAIDPEPAQLENTFHNQYANAAVSANIFDGLLTYDAGQRPQPGLATSWSVSPDGLTITFKLRQGVRWHDGVEFNSADVRYSALEVWKKVHPRGRVTFAPLLEVETPDPYTAVFHLERPAPVIISSLNTSEAQIIPEHLYEGTDVRTNPVNARPVGTGPFKFVNWKKGQYIELERNPDYWDKDRPYLDRVIFRNIPDAAARAAALETGEVDYVPYAGVPFSDVARLRQNPDLVFEPRGYSYNAQIYFVECNLRRPYLSDVRVREAIAYAIDKRGLVKTVWYDVSQPADGPIPPTLTRYYTRDKPDYPFDPAKAEALLDEAGYPRGAHGMRFSITLDLSPSADAFVAAGDYIRQNLKRIGIDVRPINSDGPTYLRKVYTNYDFDLTLQGYSALLDPEIGLTRIFWSKGVSPGVPYVNASGYANPATDKIIEAYQRELDGEKRVALFHDFQRVVMADLPLIPIMDAPFFTFYNRRIRGLDLNPDGARSSFKNVWIAHE